MIKQLKPGILVLVILTFLTGILYPLVVTALAQAIFPGQANGSMLVKSGAPVGSSLLGQGNDSPQYFQPRPSTTDYGALPSSGSNLAPTSVVLAEQVAQRAAEFRTANRLPADTAVPVEMLFASASGLDPHISPNSARMQAGRVAAARGLKEAQVIDLVESHVESPQLGFLGEARINVLLLNLALDHLQ